MSAAAYTEISATVGNVSTIRTTGGGITGDVTLGGKLGSLLVAGGDLAGNVRVGGSLASLSVVALGGVSGNLEGRVEVGGNLGTVSVANNLAARFGIWGNWTSLFVRGSVVDSYFEVGGKLTTVSVTRDFTNSSIEADALGAVTVKGTMLDDLDDGEEDEIHALTGRFTVRVGARYAVVQEGADQTFGGERCWVGEGA
jgi:hypothetical protein